MKNRLLTVLLVVSLNMIFASHVHGNSLQIPKKNLNSITTLEWEGEEENADVNYLLFGADEWDKLMPLDSADSFLTSSNASESFLLTTHQKKVQVERSHRYLRLIAQTKERSKDVLRLVTFEGRENEPEQVIAKGEDYSPEIAEMTWNEVKPYLLPKNHPVRSNLDWLCQRARILASSQALEEAGFKIIYEKKAGGLLVVKHPSLKGYLLKLYTDINPRTEWPLWVLRAKNARIIQKILNKNRYNFYMKVPKKWIYPVTNKGRPSAGEKIYPKDFILVVQDMHLVSQEKSFYYYKHAMTPNRLVALYRTIQVGGLSDSHIVNIPFTNDYKVAFIDTEYVENWPVHYEWLTEYFSPANQVIWRKLINEGNGGGRVKP